MAIDLAALRALKIVTPHRYTEKDVMLYALGLGLGANPEDEDQLRFTYEGRLGGLQALPTFGGVTGYPGFWPRERREIGIDWRRILNGEQAIHVHRPLPGAGQVTGTLTIESLIDKGPGKGAVLLSRRDVHDDASGELLCTITNTGMLRGDGGCGSFGDVLPPVPQPVPQRAPDLEVDWPVLPQAGLIYRLSGDFNPLHADPAMAREAGFDRPILHGAATWGMAGMVLLRALCDSEPARFRHFHARFTSPAYPGEVQRTQIWHTGDRQASFRVTVPARGVTVLDHGIFAYGMSSSTR